MCENLCSFMEIWSFFVYSYFAVSVYLETLSTIVEGVSSDPKKDHETVRGQSSHHGEMQLYRYNLCAFSGPSTYSRDIGAS